jgi:hypothetical protein
MSDKIYSLSFVALSIALTTLVAWALLSNSRIFLLEALHGDRRPASAVSRLIVGGFCLIMFGDIATTSGSYMEVHSAPFAIRWEVTQLGSFVITLGLALSLSLFLMGWLRGRPRRRANHGESILA